MRLGRLRVILNVLAALSVLGLAFWLVRFLPIKTQNESVVGGDLNKWVQETTSFFKDSAGLSRPWIRRQNIRATLYPDSFESRDEAIKLIAALSSAAGVSYEFNSQDSSLTIIVYSPINDGDKPNLQLWNRLGLTKEMYDVVATAGSWASGCGVYSFGSTDGQIKLTLVAADSRLAAANVRDCVIDGVVRAFGFRAGSRLVMSADGGYAQYVALAKAFHVCEDGFGGPDALVALAEVDQKRKYIDCTTEILSRKK